ncbi:MAG: cytochrome c oxidase subunit 3 [Cyclobacteriaceae bacterium]
MIREAKINEPIARNVRAMDPKKFMMWLIIVSIVMIFISLSSAYIVKQSDGSWPIIEFPEMFIWSSVIIVLSSVPMHWAYVAAKRNELGQNRLALVLTTVLAGAFIYAQWLAKTDLEINQNAYFSSGHAASSFIYVFAYLHVFHLFTGVIFLIVMLIASFRYKVHSKSMTKMEMLTTYWHFLGGLWLYLYLFLELNN